MLWAKLETNINHAMTVCDHKLKLKANLRLVASTSDQISSIHTQISDLIAIEKESNPTPMMGGRYDNQGDCGLNVNALLK